MRNTVVVLIIMCCTWSDARSADDAGGMRDPNPSVRLQAWRSFIGQGQSYQTNVDRILPLLPQGLRDTDAKVRKYTATIAMGIGLQSKKEHRFLLSGNPEVAQALLTLLSDVDPTIRVNAARAIAFGVEPSTELEEFLLAEYAREQNAGRRAELINLLIQISGEKWASSWSRKPSKPVLDLLVSAIEDGDETVRISAVDAIGRLESPPIEVLPKLVDRLDTSSAANTYLRAIQKFGAAACPYLPRLDELRAQAENIAGSAGELLRTNYNITIRRIRDACKQDGK